MSWGSSRKQMVHSNGVVQESLLKELLIVASAGLRETSTGCWSIPGLAMSGSCSIPGPEKKRERLVIRTGKRSCTERLSLVRGSQPTATWPGKSQENGYPHWTPCQFSRLLMVPPIRHTQPEARGREHIEAVQRSEPLGVQAEWRQIRDGYQSTNGKYLTDQEMQVAWNILKGMFLL